MMLPASRENANTVDVAFDVIYNSKNFLHLSLRMSRRSLEAHGHTVVAKEPKLSYYGSELPNFLVQFKGVVLH